MATTYDEKKDDHAASGAVHDVKDYETTGPDFASHDLYDGNLPKEGSIENGDRASE